jgi:hypothetical protein
VTVSKHVEFDIPTDRVLFSKFGDAAPRKESEWESD